MISKVFIHSQTKLMEDDWLIRALLISRIGVQQLSVLLQSGFWMEEMDHCGHHLQGFVSFLSISIL